MKISNPIKDSIGETLFITLYMKSLESKKKNPIINDPKACDLVSYINYDFSKYKDAIRSSVGVAVRTKHFDGIVKSYIEDHYDPIVVSIGCGLDTRYYRIGSLAKKAIFYDLDIDEVIKLRRQLITPAENNYYISSSMLDPKWMDKLKEKHPSGDFIFIIEGILMYFEEEEVKSVFQNLASKFSKSEIHFDIVNEWLSKNSHIHDSVKHTNAKFKFGTNDDKLFEKYSRFLVHTKSYLYSDFKEWKRVGLLKNFLMQVIPRYKYAGRMLSYIIK